MTILLTGSTGMVGRNILEYEAAKEYQILSPSSEELNLLDYKQTLKYLTNKQPDMIIHAAGLVGGIQANVADPVSFLVANLDMGRNLVMASLNCGIKKFLNIASSCMYPKNIDSPLKEEYILTGELEPTNEGYALAKIVITRLCEYISKTHPGHIYKTVIPCNLYGRYDKFSPKNSHMLPAVIRKIHQAKENDDNTVEIWGDGMSRREFMYAEDLADFVYFAIPRFSELPQNLNVGLGIDYSINEYYQIVASIVGFSGSYTYDLSKPVGMARKLVDTTKANQLGWHPKTSLEVGVGKTYEYFKTVIDD